MSPTLARSRKRSGKTVRAEFDAPSSVHPRTGKKAIQTEALEESVGYMLRRAQLLAFQGFLSEMRTHDVRPINYAVLVLIRSNPGMSQVTLSSALGISKPNFVMVLDGLEARGLTERRKTPGDRRAFALYLTPVGDAFTRRLEASHAHLEEQLQKRLGEKKTRTLVALLQQFCAFDDTKVES